MALGWTFFSLITSDTATTADRRWEAAVLVRALNRSLCVDPRKEKPALKGSKDIRLSLDLAVEEMRGSGCACANLAAEKDIITGGSNDEERKRRGVAPFGLCC